MKRYTKKFDEKSPIKIPYQDGEGKKRLLAATKDHKGEVQLVLMHLPYPNNVISLSNKDAKILSKAIN